MKETHRGWIGGLWVIGLEETQKLDRRTVGGAQIGMKERVTLRLVLSCSVELGHN